MTAVRYLDLFVALLPELTLVCAAIVVLVADGLAFRGLTSADRRLLTAMLACAGCIFAGGLLLAWPQDRDWLHGMLLLDSTARVVKAGLLGLTIATLLLSIDADVSRHTGEYAALILLAATGMLLLVSSQDLLMVFVSLELTSLCLYVLAGFNKRDPQSAEAALKYFLFGAMSAAFTLFGFSLLYGICGSTSLVAVGEALRNSSGDPAVLLALVFTMGGFAFKIAAVPFHLWAPDAYAGAPVPSAALIASGSKVAGFFVLAKVVAVGFASPAPLAGPVTLLSLVAALSMIVGNLAAIVQTSVRRLLAYSAVAHAGYLLLAVIAARPAATAALVYYAITYALTAIGAFGVIALAERQSGATGFDAFDGLGRRSPILASSMLVFMLSLAGIPPLAGFFGKFYVFAAALQSGLGPMLALVCLALGMSAVSLYYYLQVLKRVYVTELAPDRVNPRLPILGQIVVAALALLVILLGCVPSLLTNTLMAAP